MAGLGAAFFHSLHYLLSRRYVLRPHRSSLQLFALSHVWMALLSGLVVPMLARAPRPPIENYLGPVLASGMFYLLGQWALFAALRDTEPSTVAPLLGLKIVVLAVLTALGVHASFLRTLWCLCPLTTLQWTAVLLSGAAAWVLRRCGSSLSLRSLAIVGAACLFYSLSDLSIGVVVRRLQTMGSARGSLYGCTLTYLLNGVVGLFVLACGRRPTSGAWKESFPVALAWLGAMTGLYLAFQLVGVLLGNILQSTRGVMSVALGAWMGRYGLALHVEGTVPAGVFWRRILAATLMTVAVAAYLISLRLSS